MYEMYSLYKNVMSNICNLNLVGILILIFVCLLIRSPTMSGGMYAIARSHFNNLGGYDIGMDMWGGENLEMSFKVDFLTSIASMLHIVTFNLYFLIYLILNNNNNNNNNIMLMMIMIIIMIMTMTTTKVIVIIIIIIRLEWPSAWLVLFSLSQMFIVFFKSFCRSVFSEC